MAWTRRSAVTGAAALLVPGLARATATITFPFRLVRNRAWTAVQLNGKPELHPFLIDTASYGYAITNSAAKAAALPRATKVNALTLGGRVDVPIYSADWIVIGGALRESAVCFAGVRDEVAPEGEGVLPTAQYAVFGLDYDMQRATVASRLEQEPEGFAPLPLYVPRPAGGSIDILGSANTTDQSHLGIRPIVTAELDGVSVRLLLDTGSDVGLFLFPDYVKKNGLWDRFATSIPGSLATAGGAAPTRLVRAQRFKLANVVFQAPIVMLGRPEDADRDGTGVLDGIVGMEILRRLNLVHDRQNRRVWLRPNGGIGDGYRYDRAGLELAGAPAFLSVVGVAAGGPAAKAGLEPGDRITAWSGQPSLVGLPWALRGAPGSRFDLLVERGSRERSVVLELVERL